jgi:hypothetical protein
VEVRFFGEFEALAGGVPVPVRGTKQRTVLALLALQRGGPVSADRLIDVLWGEEQIANAVNALQAQVGQLRRTLGATAIVTSEAGYALDVGPDDLDAARFEQLVAQGRGLFDICSAALLRLVAPPGAVAAVAAVAADSVAPPSRAQAAAAAASLPRVRVPARVVCRRADRMRAPGSLGGGVVTG